MDLLRTAVLIAATIAAGLSAGLYYGFACAVMPGLRQTDDRTVVATMQGINRAILNGWFALTFAGAPMLTILAGVLHLGAGGPVLLWIAGAGVFVVAVVILTGAVNVPLNNELDAAGDSLDAAGLAAARAGFEARWVRWNTARAVVATAGFGCLVAAVTV